MASKVVAGFKVINQMKEMMKRITTKTKGDVTIRENTELTGIVTGNVLVNGDVDFIIHGMVNGTISISESSKAYIHGTVIGNIINSGTCAVFGVVNGRIIDRGGKLEIDENAQVSNE